MMIPTIHLNGTGAETLMRELNAAIDGIDVAYTAVSHMTVHGRDYYPQGQQAYQVARIEQERRLRCLIEIKNELLEMYLKIEKEVK
jgi:hypothetical protein